MSLRRHNDVATSFWRHNDVIFALCAHRVITEGYTLLCINQFLWMKASPPKYIVILICLLTLYMYYCCSLGIDSVSLELVVADTSGDTDVWVNEELVAQNLAVTTMDLGHHKPADMVTLRDAEPPSGAPEKTGKEGRTGMCIGKSWTLWFDNYTPRTTKLLGGYIGFTPSVCPSVCLSCILCPLCSAYSSGWIHFIFIHLIEQLQEVCRM